MQVSSNVSTHGIDPFLWAFSPGGAQAAVLSELWTCVEAAGANQSHLAEHAKIRGMGGEAFKVIHRLSTMEWRGSSTACFGELLFSVELLSAQIVQSHRLENVEV